MNLSSRREVASPQFPDGLVFPGYGTLKHFDPEKGLWTELELESGADSIWNPGSFSYFLWMLPVKSDGLDLMAIGCVSHTAVYFVDTLGRCSMEPFKGPPVMQSGTSLLRPDGTAFDISGLAKAAAEKFRKHDSIIREKSLFGIEAARACFWPHLKTGELKKRLKSEFKTAAGKAFWKAVSKSTSSENGTKAAEAFDHATRAVHGNVYLPEFWTRNMLAPHRLVVS